MPEAPKKKSFFVAVIRDVDEDGATLSGLIPIDYNEIGTPEFFKTILEKHPTKRTPEDWEWLFRIIVDHRDVQTYGKFLLPNQPMSQRQVSGAHLTMVYTIEIGEPYSDFYDASRNAREWRGKVGPEVMADSVRLYASMSSLQSPALDFARVVLVKIVCLGIVPKLAPENCELDFLAKQ